MKYAVNSTEYKCKEPKLALRQLPTKHSMIAQTETLSLDMIIQLFSEDYNLLKCVYYGWEMPGSSRYML